MPEPSIPESFRVLIKEFQALGLNISVINNDDETVSICDLEKDDDDDAPLSEEIEKPELFDEAEDSDDDYEDDEFEDDDELDMPDEYGDGIDSFDDLDDMGGDF